MKTTAMITIKREGKTIVIYVNDSNWFNVPDLSFIADIEVYNQPERSKREDIKCNECGFFKQNKKKDIRIPCACDDAVL